MKVATKPTPKNSNSNPSFLLSEEVVKQADDDLLSKTKSSQQLNVRRNANLSDFKQLFSLR